MSNLQVISVKQAESILAHVYADRRALARKAAASTQIDCIHEMLLATCAVCMGQDPQERVINRTTGEEEAVPVNEIVSTKWSGRGYENRTNNAMIHDNEAWRLQHARRRI